MTDRQTRACCYGVMFVMVAIDWTMVGTGLFISLMDFVCDRPNHHNTPRRIG